MKYKICQAFYSETGDWCEFSARNNTTTHCRLTIGEKHGLGHIFINQLTNSSTLRLLRCGACCTTHLLTHLHERILLPWLVPASFIYKLGMLTGQRFQAELSPSFLWKFTEFRAQTPPHAFEIPNCVTLPMSSEFQSKKPPSPSEFQDATRGMVWIFSGITH